LDKENRGFQWLAHIIMIVLSVACILPFILLIVASFTDENTIVKDGYTFFPKKFSLTAYQYLMSNSASLLHAYGLTILITVVGTLASLVITSLLAYPISRRDLPKRNFFTFLVFFTLLFNGGLVPTYLVYTQVFQLKDTIWALIVPGLLANGFNILLMRTFFITSIPEALIESARIDGAGEFKTFFSIVMPLSMPILATVGLIQGLGYWNDWFNGLVYITDPNLFSIQVILNHIMSDIQFLATSNMGTQSGQGATQLPSETVRMAIAAVGVVPILIAYPFFQKFFVKGITVGAVKG